MRQGDYKRISVVIIGLSGFMLITPLPIQATQNITLGVPGVVSVGISQSQASGLSVNATMQLPTTESLALAWNPSTSPNVVGYDVYYGGSSGVYTNEIPAGNATNLTIPGLLDGATYYFVVTAVNNSGFQSGFSSQLPYTVPNIPVLESPVLSSSGFSFSVAGTQGSNCVIQVSTNLMNWSPLETNTIPFQFTDANANQYSERFYRAVYP
jgi:hypothetical protein